MFSSFDNLQKVGQQNLEAAIEAAGAWSKGSREIAVEASDYARTALERNSAALREIAEAPSIEKALEIQGAFAKEAFEGYAAQSARFGELWVALAAETAKSFKTSAPKARGTAGAKASAA